MIVAVDVSESMTTVDPDRTTERNEKLATILGLERGKDAAGLSRARGGAAAHRGASFAHWATCG